MNITLCSAFRNAREYLFRYMVQTENLREGLAKRNDTLTLVLGEGDSTDDTFSSLMLYLGFSAFDMKIVDCTHNGPHFESIEHPQRFKQLAYVGNKILAAIPDDADIVLWVESDLIWKPEILLALINRLQYLPCVAPMIMEKSTGGFYDTWAYRRNGVQFSKSYPYHIDYRGDLLEMDSVGSCWAIRADLARKVNFPESDVVVGLCNQVRALGETIWLDPALTVWHP